MPILVKRKERFSFIQALPKPLGYSPHHEIAPERIRNGSGEHSLLDHGNFSDFSTNINQKKIIFMNKNISGYSKRRHGERRKLYIMPMKISGGNLSHFFQKFFSRDGNKYRHGKLFGFFPYRP